MKTIIFTHKNDIDGMGNAILAKLAFKETKYVLCGTFDLIKNVNDYIDSKEIYNYDKIFITDLCLDLKTLNKIEKDKILKSKIQLIDHHKTYDTEDYKKFPFVKICLETNKGLSCATSLFYEYLLENNYLKENKIISEFVELTRQHDTWEWKNIYNNEKSRELAILFDCLGTNGYINYMYNKLITEKDFEFDSVEKMLIENKKEEIKEALNEYEKHIFNKEILGYKTSIIFINYEHRNEIADYLKEKGYDTEVIMMISLDRGVVSYRRTNKNVIVREVAEYFGGKGHDAAATNPITKEQQEKILDILTNAE